MKRLSAQLEPLLGALTTSRSAGVPSTSTITEVSTLVRSIEQKLRFVEIHRSFLVGVKWNHVDSIGRSGGLANGIMRVSVPEAAIEFSHPSAARDHVYLACDGAVTAIVNITDTFARAVNAAYTLGVDERRATLRSVRTKCEQSSPIGKILWDDSRLAWFDPLRDLRGRFQHGDLHEGILSPKAYGQGTEPTIDGVYGWSGSIGPISVTSYIDEAIVLAEGICCDCIDAILSCPDKPCGIVTPSAGTKVREK